MTRPKSDQPLTTVAQMLEVLKTMPPDMVLCVEHGGDRGGYRPLSLDVHIIDVSDWGSGDPWTGRFEDDDGARPADDPFVGHFQAVYVPWLGHERTRTAAVLLTLQQTDGSTCTWCVSANPLVDNHETLAAHVAKFRPDTTLQSFRWLSERSEPTNE